MWVIFRRYMIKMKKSAGKIFIFILLFFMFTITACHQKTPPPTISELPEFDDEELFRASYVITEEAKYIEKQYISNEIQFTPFSEEEPKYEMKTEFNYAENTWQYVLYNYLLEMSRKSDISMTFSLYDFDDDGIPEIITFTPPYSELHAYHQNKYKMLYFNKYSSFCSFEGLPIIASLYGPSMGHGSFRYFTINEHDIIIAAEWILNDIDTGTEYYIGSELSGGEKVSENRFNQFVKELIGSENVKNDEIIRKLFDNYLIQFNFTVGDINKAIEMFNNGYKIVNEPINKEDAHNSFSDYMQGEREAYGNFYGQAQHVSINSFFNPDELKELEFSLIDLDGDGVEELIVRRADGVGEIQILHYFCGEIHLWANLDSSKEFIYGNGYLERRLDTDTSLFYRFNKYGEWESTHDLRIESANSFTISDMRSEKRNITQKEYEQYVNKFRGEEIIWLQKEAT